VTSFETAFSRVYDAIFPPRPSVQALLGDLADRAPAPRWLDVACGTGRHAIFLALRGMRVTAIDLDPLMIRQARRAAQRAGLSIDLRLGDMSRSETYRGLGRRIGGASCLGNSLVYAAAPGDLERTIGHIAACLVDGGCFLVQVVNFDHFADRPSYAFPPIPVPSAGLIFRRRYERLEGGVLAFHLELDSDAGGGETLKATHLIRPLTLADLESALEAAGMTVRERWGDFDRRPWSAEAPATVVLAAR